MIDADVLELLRGRGPSPLLETLTPQEARERAGVPRPEHGHGPTSAAEHHVTDPVPMLVIEPVGGFRRVVVYVHGGGWTVGSAAAALPLARHLAEESSAAVAVLDYRLAPEHPFPAALDDVAVALEAVRLRYPTLPVVVVGESAGGNLAAAACLSRNTFVELLVLVSPVLDCDQDRSSYQDAERQHFLPSSTLRWFWEQYVPDPADRAHWRAAPLRAPTLQTLPPTLLIGAENEILRDEIEEFGRRLADEGVSHRVEIVPGQAHGFFTALNILPASRAGVSRVARAVAALSPAASRSSNTTDDDLEGSS